MNDPFVEGYEAGYWHGEHPDDNPYKEDLEADRVALWDDGYHQGRKDWRNGYSYHPYPGSY